ncbi:MAG: TAXI family TRAP transporter solute-binding subunit [Mycobacterium sp.]
MLNRRPAEISRRTFLLATAVLSVGCGRSDPRGRVRLASGDPGGLYFAFATILSEQLHRRYPDIVVDVLPTEGSVENLARLRSGDADFGLALADVTERDRDTVDDGSAPWAAARVYENYLQVVVRDSAAVQHLSDLRGRRVSIGPSGSGGATTSEVLFTAAAIRDQVDIVGYRLGDGLSALADGRLDAIVWSGGVPTPAITDVDAVTPLRMIDVRSLAVPMSRLAGYPYVVHRVPTGQYVPPEIRSLGVPNLLLCRRETSAELVGAVVDVLATEAPNLVPPYVRGLQYLDAPSMIQTGQIPLHQGAVDAYRRLHG